MFRLIEYCLFGKRMDTRPARMRVDREEIKFNQYLMKTDYDTSSMVIRRLIEKGGYNLKTETGANFYIQILMQGRAVKSGADVANHHLTQIFEQAAKDKNTTLALAVIEVINDTEQFQKTSKDSMKEIARRYFNEDEETIGKINSAIDDGIKNIDRIKIRKLNHLSSDYRVYLENQIIKLLKGLPEELRKEYLEHFEEDPHYPYPQFLPLVKLSKLSEDINDENKNKQFSSSLIDAVKKMEWINKFEQALNERDKNTRTLLEAEDRLNNAERVFFTFGFQDTVTAHRDSKFIRFFKSAFGIFNHQSEGKHFVDRCNAFLEFCKTMPEDKEEENHSEFIDELSETDPAIYLRSRK